MKIVPFWRTSLSESKSRQYYFDHFEIHPIKVRCFLLYSEMKHIFVHLFLKGKVILSYYILWEVTYVCIPLQIIANFLPGESYSSYSSAEETLRSLLHSVVKVSQTNLNFSFLTLACFIIVFPRISLDHLSITLFALFLYFFRSLQ